MKLVIQLICICLIFSCTHTKKKQIIKNLSVENVGAFHLLLGYQLSTSFDIYYCGILGYSFNNSGMTPSDNNLTWEITSKKGENETLEIVKWELNLLGVYDSPILNQTNIEGYCAKLNKKWFYFKIKSLVKDEKENQKFIDLLLMDRNRE